jgi:solute carrier family 13 (sodium-dependent dicarboxylate transporter), member 2/3/5
MGSPAPELAAPEDGASAQRAKPKLLGLALAASVVALSAILPAPEGLSVAAKNLVGVFCVAMILWVTEAIPIAATALLVIVLQPLLHVTTVGAAASGFMSPVFFFVVAMFCIAEVVQSSGLARRFALALLERARGDSRRVVLAFMVGAAAMSTIVSDVPVAAVWMSMALPLLAQAGAEPGRSALGKALMIGIPVAAFIGGVGTPAGSSINILGLHQLEQFGKVKVSFVQWMALGLPMVLVLTPLAWLTIVGCFPPEVASVGSVEQTRRERSDLPRLSSAERKVLMLLGAMIVLWVASSWVRAIDTTVVALGGAIAMFLPGVNLLTWPRAQRAIGWDAVLLIGGVTSLGAAAASSGLATYLVSELPNMQGWPIYAVVALLSLVAVLIHLPLPVNPAVVGVLVPPIALMALSWGKSPALFGLPVVITASCAMLLPLDAVTVITYSKGYYRMTDMLLPGAIISLLWVLMMTAVMAFVAPLVGIS